MVADNETLIEQFEHDYLLALKTIEEDVKELIVNKEEMRALFLFDECLLLIQEIYDSLHFFYSKVYNNQNVLQQYGSERFKQLKYELKPTSKLLSHSSLEVKVIESHVLNELKKVGFNSKHWYLKECIINEIEYMIKTLKVVMEPEFSPPDHRDVRGSENEKENRHIPSSIKIAVWRRDFGKCVECGSKEKLEYDHIIPVSKGGSNTERNVQLLCEKCNRQKSANIQ